MPETSLLNIFAALQSEHFGAVARSLLLGGLHTEAVAMLFAVVEKRRCSAQALSLVRQRPTIRSHLPRARHIWWR